MYFTCDDVGLEHKEHLYKLEDLKKQDPTFKVTVFVIAKGLNDYLFNWLKQDWIEVGVHCYDHDKPECDYEDKEDRITKAFNILKPLLPKQYGYRTSGYQMTASMYPIVKKLGFSYIAHQTRVQSFKGEFKRDNIINTHIYDKEFKLYGKSYRFISEGFHNNAVNIST